MQDKDSKRAEFRADLIKRLFAVAISVGAASTISRMHWVTEGIAPNLCEWEQISILSVAMIATVLSWDGYLSAIEERPLDGRLRFTIDILLVFIYMFLLMTSVHHSWWLPIHALTFFLYFKVDFARHSFAEIPSIEFQNDYLGAHFHKRFIKGQPIIRPECVRCAGKNDVDRVCHSNWAINYVTTANEARCSIGCCLKTLLAQKRVGVCIGTGKVNYCLTIILWRVRGPDQRS